MQKYYNEPMLSKITYSSNMNDIEFEFYDSFSGDDLGKIICKHVFAFNFNTNCERNIEVLPCLVFDVYSRKLEMSEVKEAFKNINYSYKAGYTTDQISEVGVPISDTYYEFRIVNGPVDIEVICCLIEVEN